MKSLILPVKIQQWKSCSTCCYLLSFFVILSILLFSLLFSALISSLANSSRAANPCSQGAVETLTIAVGGNRQHHGHPQHRSLAFSFESTAYITRFLASGFAASKKATTDDASLGIPSTNKRCPCISKLV